MNRREYAMIKLAKMASENIAKSQKCSKLHAYMKFMTSKTGEMLFDPESGLWMNGPDCLADEYRREMYYKKHGVPMDRR